MNYLISYLQFAGLYAILFVSVFCIDAFVIHDPRYAIQILIKKEYEGYRDILRFLKISVVNVLLWPIGTLFLVLFVSFTLYDRWTDP